MIEQLLFTDLLSELASYYLRFPQHETDHYMLYCGKIKGIPGDCMYRGKCNYICEVKGIETDDLRVELE